MRKLKQTFILKALEKELKEHDWTFQMSDDHGYYSNGISEQARIKTMVQDAYAEGCDPADLFYQFIQRMAVSLPTIMASEEVGKSN